MALEQLLILSSRPAGDDKSLYFVQSAQGGRAGFLAEAVSNRYLIGAAQLSPTEEEAMAALGWQFPGHHATKPENLLPPVAAASPVRRRRRARARDRRRAPHHPAREGTRRGEIVDNWLDTAVQRE